MELILAEKAQQLGRGCLQKANSTTHCSFRALCSCKRFEEEIILVMALFLGKMHTCLCSSHKRSQEGTTEEASGIEVQCSVFPRNQVKTFIEASIIEVGQDSSLFSAAFVLLARRKLSGFREEHLRGKSLRVVKCPPHLLGWLSVMLESPCVPESLV